jgi:hypothetical protein
MRPSFCETEAQPNLGRSRRHSLPWMRAALRASNPCAARTSTVQRRALAGLHLLATRPRLSPPDPRCHTRARTSIRPHCSPAPSMTNSFPVARSSVGTLHGAPPAPRPPPLPVSTPAARPWLSARGLNRPVMPRPSAPRSPRGPGRSSRRPPAPAVPPSLPPDCASRHPRRPPAPCALYCVTAVHLCHLSPPPLAAAPLQRLRQARRRRHPVVSVLH